MNREAEVHSESSGSLFCCFLGDGAEAPPPDRWGGGGVPSGTEAGLQRSLEEPALLHPAGCGPQRSEPIDR